MTSAVLIPHPLALRGGICKALPLTRVALAVAMSLSLGTVMALDVTTVSTAAGTTWTIAPVGSPDGLAYSAYFSLPMGLCFTSSGNLLIGDRNAVRMLDVSNMMVSTLVGSTVFSTTLSPTTIDGYGSYATFGEAVIAGISEDASHDLYLSTSGGGNLRKVIYGNYVTTIPGVTKATGVASGIDGKTYVSETLGSLFLVTPGATPALFAGSQQTVGYADGVGTAARFGSATALAVDSDGVIYVADTNNSCIRSITPAGVVTTIASVAFPTGIAVGANNSLYVISSYSTLLRIAPDKSISVLAGKLNTAGYVNGVGSNSLFNGARSVAVDPGTGDVYVSDVGNRVIRKIATTHTQTITFPNLPPQQLVGVGVKLAAASDTGLPITYSIISGSAIIDADNILTATDPGLVVVQADQVGGVAANGYSYGAASGAARFFTAQSMPMPALLGTLTASLDNAFPFWYQIKATNTPTGYFASGLPAGLTLDPLLGIISGTALSTGTFQVEIQASNSSGTAAGSLNLTIADTRGPVDAFVTGFYTKCLNRSADSAGLNSWTLSLLSKTKIGTDVARGFVLSAEFQARNLTDDAYVESLYQAFFNRPSDAGGKSVWVDQLKAGVLREDVLYGFVMAPEFANLCSSYGISKIDALGMQQYQVRQFVRGFYQQCLGREPDAAGIANWTSQLIAGTVTGRDVARGFVLSAEFVNKNVSSSDFLDTLYLAFFGRAADVNGKNAWAAQLLSGSSRSAVLNGFVSAQEFVNLCAKYGIIPFPVSG